MKPINQEPRSDVLTAKEAAAYLKICDKTLWNLTLPRGPIPVSKVGRSNRYQRKHLQEYLDRQSSNDSSGADRPAA